MKHCGAYRGKNFSKVRVLTLLQPSEHLVLKGSGSSPWKKCREDLRSQDSWTFPDLQDSTSKCSKLACKMPPLCPARCWEDLCVRVTYTQIKPKIQPSRWLACHRSPVAAWLRIFIEPSVFGLNKALFFSMYANESCFKFSYLDLQTLSSGTWIARCRWNDIFIWNKLYM